MKFVKRIYRVDSVMETGEVIVRRRDCREATIQFKLERRIAWYTKVIDEIKTKIMNLRTFTLNGRFYRLSLIPSLSGLMTV